MFFIENVFVFCIIQSRTSHGYVAHGQIQIQLIAHMIGGNKGRKLQSKVNSNTGCELLIHAQVDDSKQI